jgi:hypothetical protein
MSRTPERISDVRRVRAFARSSAVFAVFLMISSVAGASEGEDLRDRFGAFVDAGPHVVIQRAKGGVGTNFGVEHNKANIIASMTFRLGGGIKGPELAGVWGRPRPVLWAAALIPLNASSTIGTKFVEGVVQTGQRIDSSKFTLEYQTGGLVALGLEFEVPVFDGSISITPAFESLTLPTRYTGHVETKFSQGTNNHRLDHNTNIIQSFVGPALRLGAPTVVVRGVAIDFYLDASLLLDVAGTHRAQTKRDPANGDRAKFTWETGSGLIQVGSGVQIRWP